MKALYLFKDQSASFVQGFPAPDCIESRPIPGGDTSSEALDAIGNRCNHLSHADEPHHVEWGDQQSQGFRSCESNRDVWQSQFSEVVHLGYLGVFDMPHQEVWWQHQSHL